MGYFSQLGNFILNKTGKSYIDNIPIDVISEKSRSLPVAVTSKRVENGFNITDTTRKEQQIISITVVDNSKEYLSNRESLIKLQEKGDLVVFYYNDRDTYENMVIENIEEIESADQKNGFTYYITLRQVQVAEVTESDTKVDYKKAGSSGGNKVRKTAKITTPNKTEVGKANAVINEKGSTVANNIF